MAMNDQGKAFSRWHFLFRFLGLTGLAVGVVGGVLIALDMREEGLGLVAGGGFFALLALLIEFVRMVRRVAGRREAFAVNAALQAALAFVLVGGINIFSFFHHQRWDLTRGQRFTLPEELRDQLAHLRSDEPTTIVVHLRHVAFGSDKPDNYDSAAERKVVEKVKDLVRQFQELGPKFQVVVLDVQEEGYGDRLEAVTQDVPALREAIDRAPENSIFFHAGGRVQRLGFQDIYVLDKQASRAADEGRGNLVLLSQGMQPFVNKVLNIDERRPRVAVGVIHPLLSMAETEEISMAGVQKVLEARGFDARDVILKKGLEEGKPESAAFTYDEGKFERLEAEIAEMDAGLTVLEQELSQLNEYLKDWKTKPVEELQKSPLARQLRLKKVNEEIRQAVVREVLELLVSLRQLSLEETRKEREAKAEAKGRLNVDNLAEQRRITDVKAKMDRLLADCDLLILPRLTLRDVIRDWGNIPPWVHNLDDEQTAAIKEFLKAGKPVLFCFGPTNEETPGRSELMGISSDKLESELERLGLKFGKQTILFNVESKGFGERRGGLIVLGAKEDVPPAAFEGRPSGSAAPLKQADTTPHPLRESMRLTMRGLSGKEALDLRLRHPRPIYYEPVPDETSTVEPIFMLTAADSWNEDQPFPTRERVPRFEPPKPGDATIGTLDERRRGPFPIGVAVEKSLPSDWYADPSAAPAKVRIAAIGHGGVFIGDRLSPAREKLLLDVCNWLLGRDDLLTKGDKVWQYPRVEMTDRERLLWLLGACVGLPMVFVYLGIVVLMLRQVR